MERINKIGIAFCWMFSGMVLGVMIAFLSYKEAIQHSNTCQEKELLETIAEMKTEKNWYIKENSNGKLKIVEMTKQELDSLTEVTATEQ